MLNLMTGVFSLFAGVLWFLSTFDVQASKNAKVEGWDITFDRGGKEYSVNRTLKRQSRLNQWAAVCAGVAALLQSYGAFMDFLK